MKIVILLLLVMSGLGVNAQFLDISPEEFNIVAKQQANRGLLFLQKNISYLANRNHPNHLRSYREKIIIERFTPGAVIEVAGKLFPKRRTSLSASDYFRRVRNYNYDDVKIEFPRGTLDRINRVGEHTWFVDFTVEQTFEGIKKGKVHYNDITIKSFKIKVEYLYDNHKNDYVWVYSFASILVESIR